jgi:hypothetical protein
LQKLRSSEKSSTRSGSCGSSWAGTSCEFNSQCVIRSSWLMLVLHSSCLDSILMSSSWLIGRLLFCGSVLVAVTKIIHICPHISTYIIVCADLSVPTYTCTTSYALSSYAHP